MADAIKDIVIRITAQQEGFENIDSAASSVDQLTGSTSQATVASISFAEKITKSAASLESIGRFGHSAMNILDRLELTEISLQNANNNLTNAQFRYNDALEKYGANSQEAIIAGNNLEKANNMVEKANIRAGNSYAMIGLAMVGMVPSIVQFGTYMKNTLTEVEGATLATSLRIRAMVPELLIIGAIVGGAYYLWQKAANETAEANKELAVRMASDYSNAKEKVEALTKSIETLKGIVQEAKTSEMLINVEYQAKEKTITESGRSEEEKAKAIADNKKKWNMELANLNLEIYKKNITAIDKEIVALGETPELLEKKRIALAGVAETQEYIAKLEDKSETKGVSKYGFGAAVPTTAPEISKPAPLAVALSETTKALAEQTKELPIQKAIMMENVPTEPKKGTSLLGFAEYMVKGFVGLPERTWGAIAPTAGGIAGAIQPVLFHTTNVILDGQIIGSIVDERIDLKAGKGINSDGIGG